MKPPKQTYYKQIGTLGGLSIYRTLPGNVDNEPDHFICSETSGFRFWLAMRIYDLGEWLIRFAINRVRKQPKRLPPKTYSYKLTLVYPEKKEQGEDEG